MKIFSKAKAASHLIHPRDISDIAEQEHGLYLSNAGYLLGILLSLGGFFLLAALTQVERPWSFESSILLYLHSHATSVFDELALLVSTSVTVVAVIVLLSLLYRRAWYATAFWLSATLGTEAITQAAKHFFHHSRPQLWDVISPQSSYAFPSGHASLSMSIVLAFIFLSFFKAKSLVQLCTWAAFVVAVGISRMYLGVHFPTDILAGWTLAIAWICVLVLMFKNAGRTASLGSAI